MAWVGRDYKIGASLKFYMGQNVYALTYQKFCLSFSLIKNMEKSNLSVKGLVLSTITLLCALTLTALTSFYMRATLALNGLTILRTMRSEQLRHKLKIKRH